jgi:hypothetical protein
MVVPSTVMMPPYGTPVEAIYITVPVVPLPIVIPVFTSTPLAVVVKPMGTEGEMDGASASGMPTRTFGDGGLGVSKMMRPPINPSAPNATKRGKNIMRGNGDGFAAALFGSVRVGLANGSTDSNSAASSCHFVLSRGIFLFL